MRLSSTLGCFPELNMVMQEEAGQPISRISRISNLSNTSNPCLLYFLFNIYYVQPIFIILSNFIHLFSAKRDRHRNHFFWIFVSSFSFVCLEIMDAQLHADVIRTIHPRLLSAASCQENRVYRAAAAVSLFGVKTRSHPSSRVSGYRSVLRYLTALRCVVFRWKHIRFAVV